MKLTVGADVEVFGVGPNGHIALCGKIGGTKDHPRQLEHLPAGFMVQEDNVSLEYNIPPVTNSTNFVSYISTMRNEVGSILEALGASVSKDCAVSFDKRELTHPSAMVFGCEPDYNAWTKVENERPYCEDKCLRTAGGHVHVGVEGVDMLNGIRAMDLYLGVPSVILDNSPASVRRRELYGKAGAMRPKPYGFEYRVLSNYWMFDDALISWVFTNTHAAMEFATKGEELSKKESKVVQECINTGNVELAKTLVKQYEIPMPGDAVKVAEAPRVSKPRRITGEIPTGLHMPVDPIPWQQVPATFWVVQQQNPPHFTDAMMAQIQQHVPVATAPLNPLVDDNEEEED